MDTLSNAYKLPHPLLIRFAVCSTPSPEGEGFRGLHEYSSIHSPRSETDEGERSSLHILVRAPLAYSSACCACAPCLPAA